MSILSTSMAPTLKKVIAHTHQRKNRSLFSHSRLTIGVSCVPWGKCQHDPRELVRPMSCVHTSCQSHPSSSCTIAPAWQAYTCPRSNVPSHAERPLTFAGSCIAEMFPYVQSFRLCDSPLTHPGKKKENFQPP